MQDRTTKITMLVDAAQGKAATAELNAGVVTMEKNFQSSAVAASAAFTSIEVGEKRVGQSSSVMAAQMQEATAASNSLAQSQVKAAIATETNTVAATEGAAANTALGQSVAAAGAESEISSAKIVKVGIAVDKLGGVAIPGGKAIGTLTGALSSLSLVQLGTIAGVALLIGYLVHLFKAKEDQVKVDQDMIRANLDVQRTMNTGTLFTREYARVLHDTELANSVLKTSYQNLSVAQGEEADAIAGEARAMKGAAAASTDLATKIILYARAELFGAGSQQEATSARLEAQKSFHSEVEARIKAWAETNKSIDALKAEFAAIIQDKNALNDLIITLDAGAAAQARFSAGTSAIGKIRTKVAMDAAEANQKLTHSEAERRFAEEASRQGLTQLVETTRLAEKNQKAFTESHKSGGSAARQYANELVNLQKRVAEAEGVLGGDSFTNRQSKIGAEINAERAHLEINKRDRTAALEALDRIEHAQIQKVAQDRTDAEQRVMMEIARMHIEAGDNEIAKKKQLMDLDIALRSQALTREFGDTSQTQDLIKLYKQAKEEEYVKWYLDLWSKTDASRLAAERQMMDTLEAEREKRDKATLDKAVRLAKQIEAARGAIGGQIGGSLVSPASSGQVDSLIKQIERLGPAFLTAGKDANVIKVALDQVDKLFGFVGRDARTLGLQLRAVEQYGKGNAFGGLVTSLKALGSELINGGRLAIGFAQTLGNAFSSALGSGQNFIAQLGSTMISGLTSIVGQMLMQYGIDLVAHGIASVLKGTAIMADPFSFAFPFGAAMVAAGHAEIAQGIVFGAAGGAVSGLGQMAANKISGGGGSSAGASSSSAVVASSAPAARSATPRQPTFINVATSAEARQDASQQRLNREVIAQRAGLDQSSPGPVTFVIQLGTEAGNQFFDGLMKGRAVLTMNNATGQYKGKLKKGLGL